MKKQEIINNQEYGLLVIDNITNKNFLVFYIQPQEVNKGSAISSCFHFAFRNLDPLELVPKFNYNQAYL